MTPTLTITPPRKTAHRYVFDVKLAGFKTSAFQLGFESLNYKIRHHWVWDSFYPIPALLGPRSPIIEQNHRWVNVVFKYPVHEHLPAFFQTQAANRGVEVRVHARTFAAQADLNTVGDVLPFSGGKDSRLLLGLLRETGHTPQVCNAVHDPVTDVACLCTRDLGYKEYGWVLTNRLMPSLMLAPARWYYGGSFEYVHKRMPWHIYYDFGSPEGAERYHAYLASMGVHIAFLVPLTVLTVPAVQRILIERYPELFRFQRSCPQNQASDKNLDISLAKHYAHVSFTEHCTLELFQRLLQGFVSRRLARPDWWGTNDERYGFWRTDQAIIHHLKDDPLFACVRDSVPDAWQGDWIDYTHDYVYTPPTGFLDIYRQYAPSADGVI